LGRGIVTCLLANGLSVVAYNRTAKRTRTAVQHVGDSLAEMARRGAVRRPALKEWRRRLVLADEVEQLSVCGLVIESVKEDLELKRALFARLEAALSPRAVIASNTSSLPITLLQQMARRPERFVGMHWGEPVEVMRYLEIIPGRATSAAAVRCAVRLGRLCGKDPTVLKEDIRGFISNRLMYAMMREACHLVEAGIADLATVDRSFRNDIGWWATIAGPFRWMDLTGIPAYATVMEGLFPELSNETSTPRIMREAVARGAEGISNRKGFYRYSKAEAKEWERLWVDFAYEVRGLLQKYERRVKL
jgi:3-hydroxybutyryl-CoA dehydrogenase